MSRIIGKFGFLAAFTIGFAGQAAADADLKSSVPADNSSVDASPAELDLTFSEALNLPFSGATITGPNQMIVRTGDTMLINGNMVLIVPVWQTLPAGTYTVDWHALSTDGRKTSGTYKFTVKP